MKKAFHRSYNHDERSKFVRKCHKDNPNHIPVFVYPAQAFERDIRLKSNKYVVNKNMTVGRFVYYIRTNCSETDPTKGLLFFTDKGEIPNLSYTMEELYNRYVDHDGFLYIQVAQESVFGHIHLPIS